tara:strand:+ start:95 stop:460 length:366 start_codon:yes stop_codon:yes gene_type:complete
MGLMWWLPDSQSFRGYFKFLPRNDESVGLEPSKTEIIGLERSLLSNPDDGSANHLAFELIRIREQQKDWLLNQLPTYVHSSLNGSKHLHSPPSVELISPLLIELIEEVHLIRSLLEAKISG